MTKKKIDGIKKKTNIKYFRNKDDFPKVQFMENNSPEKSLAFVDNCQRDAETKPLQISDFFRECNDFLLKIDSQAQFSRDRFDLNIGSNLLQEID